MLSVLLSPERSTVTNLICASGRQQQDWGADYRLYSRGRVQEPVLFDAIRSQVIEALGPEAPLVVAMDDTLAHKSGTHIDGVGWRRDPLGPPFQTNLVRAQRFVQFSAAWPLENGQARMVPIGFFHAPSAPKMSKEATSEERKLHLEEQKQKSLNSQALAQMQRLREKVEPARRIHYCGDGSYTNAAILKALPGNSVYIGRIRKDAKLHHLPEPRAAAPTGRPASYGDPAHTPEQLRAEESVAWQTVDAFAAGERHPFRLKTLGPVLWRKSGAALPVMIVVIAPLAYRLRKGSRLLYRRPAYLICTDPRMAIEELLQQYLWRWGIEVNFREEKSLIGVGEAQVRTVPGNRILPAVVVAAYALLWVSALQLRKQGMKLPWLQPPKWRKARRDQGALFCTGDLLRTLRFETWQTALRPGSFYHFVNASDSNSKCQKPEPSLPGILFNAA
jgi:hypothetical protein